MNTDIEETYIGGIGNYYGGLNIKSEKGKFYWGIENHNGTEYKEIPEKLFKTLLNYEKKYLKQQKNENSNK